MKCERLTALIPAFYPGAMESTQVPCISVGHEWGERRGEVKLDKIASSPHPSPPSCVRRRGGKSFKSWPFLTCVDTIAPGEKEKRIQPWCFPSAFGSLINI